MAECLAPVLVLGYILFELLCQTLKYRPQSLCACSFRHLGATLPSLFCWFPGYQSFSGLLGLLMKRFLQTFLLPLPGHGLHLSARSWLIGAVWPSRHFISISLSFCLSV